MSMLCSAACVVQVENVKKKCNENLCGLTTEIRALEVVRSVASHVLTTAKLYTLSSICTFSNPHKRRHSR